MNSVADSSPASGISGLYVSSSVWMASSVSIRSALAISWIWNRTVSRLSKTSVTKGPTWTLRRRLRAITPSRNASRSLS